MNKEQTTKRAYTLRLHGVAGNKLPQANRDTLWRTHAEINRGTKIFGDYLLTFCGGISPSLADGDEIQTNLTDEEKIERKNRRIIFALTWLSVEDKAGASSEEKYLVEDTKEALEKAFKEILQTRGLSAADAGSWYRDCEDSLSAAIRDDAVRVNRAKMFDDLKKKWQIPLGDAEIWDWLSCGAPNSKKFFKDKESFIAPVKKDDKRNAASSESSSEAEPTSKKDSDNGSVNMAQAANGWLSNRFGGGKGADYEKLTDGYRRIAEWLEKNIENLKNGRKTWGEIFQLMASEAFKTVSLQTQDKSGILSYLKASGHRSATVLWIKNVDNSSFVTEKDAETLKANAKKGQQNATDKIGSKGPRDYADKILETVVNATGIPYKSEIKGKRDRRLEYCVMLDHAARKLVSRLSNIKNAEAKRLEFEQNRAKLDKVPDKAKKWLDAYCNERTTQSNTADQYRIRRTAVVAWKEIFEAWKGLQRVEERIDKVKEIQAESEEKIGDVNLFFALAEEDAEPVRENIDILVNYAAGKQGEYDMRRFKVPMYRHPDPLRHPIFCDFGDSRPGITYSARDAADPAKKEKQSSASKSKKSQTPPADNLPVKPRLRGVTLDLVNATDGGIDKTTLRWSNKRLSRDMGLDLFQRPDFLQNAPIVGDMISRRDRFGRNALPGGERSFPDQLPFFFSKEKWNGRLQATRAELDRLATLIQDADPFDKNRWPERAQKALNRVKWFLSFSPDLKFLDPWNRYDAEFSTTSSKTNGRRGPKNEIRSRLPGLRILSVDLGRRFGATCAVWEVVSQKEINAAAKERGIALPSENAIYFIAKDAKRKTVYRRIDGNHPEDSGGSVASNSFWAKLTRQFTIKLPGEGNNEIRKSTDQEIEDAIRFLNNLGRILSEPERKSLKRVDTLLERLVDSIRLRLWRHGDVVRAARALEAEEKTVPGNVKTKIKGEEAKRESILSGIRILYDLRRNPRWICPKSVEIFWNENVEPLLNRPEFKKAQDWDSNAKESATSDFDGRNRRRRKADDEKWNEAFRPIAQRLLAAKNRNSSIQKTIEFWKTEDDQIKELMRQLRKTVFPRPGKAGKISADFRKRVSRRGGLSMGRINLIRKTYDVFKAFYQRPGGNNEKIAQGDSGLRNFGKRILDAHERLRTNRVKQLVSRIIEAALGLGGGFEGSNKSQRCKKSESPNNRESGSSRPPLSQYLDRKQDQRQPSAPCFRPCHAVIIENLQHYRPDQTQARRESRMLAQWSSGKVRDLLHNHCELYGFFLFEVNAAYTSRQDSRTGLPGTRCVDVPVTDFLSSPYWNDRIKKIQEKKKNDLSPTEQLILDLFRRYEKYSQEALKKTRPLRIPQKGGSLFVAAGGDSFGIQADINAAANIGLRALLDPNAPFSYWKITCDSQSGRYKKTDKQTKVKPPVSDSQHQFLAADELQKIKNKSGVVNAWRDVSADELTSEQSVWLYTTDYWTDVERRVCDRLRKYNGLDDERSNDGDIPF